MTQVVHVVDDEIGILEALSDCLEFTSDFEVKTYSNVIDAQKGLENLKNEGDILITDMRMPGHDGLFLLQWLQKKKIPLRAKICMTGYSEYDEAYLKEFGMTQLFQKPLCFDQLIDYLEQLE